MHRYKRSKGKFAGRTIVPLHDVTVRECVRFWKDGYKQAILQKNGNVAVSGSGFFNYDGDTHPVAVANVARALVGLKLYDKDWAQPFIEAEEAHKRELDVTSLKYEADRLNYMITPFDKATGK